ncbi:zinc-finger transcription factor [Fusarium beomiforme]|uniref:Zinc-finger transcription factor n=1 Tax=Fusarium beomiforme TaxID=44412 RepID=A0A9P5AHL0_9HYPO|nr:zinc-finger transcription factor [Fusarium beomiforme]
MKPRKACWTCTARKIQCDGLRPKCGKCDRSQLVCQGYETRLSWPRNNDRKRAIVCNTTQQVPSSPRKKSEIPSGLFLINTSSQDVELYNYLSSQYQQALVTTSPSSTLKQPGIHANQNELFQYFYDLAHLSLVTFSSTTARIRDALMTRAIDNTASGSALLHAILAYSSLHRHGLSKIALKFKVQALHLLSTSVKDGQMSVADASQHVATSMLLGSFETLRPTESSGEWLWHTWGAMDVIQATKLDDHSAGSETYYLLDWANYHHTLSRFSTKHWRYRVLNLETSDPSSQYSHVSPPLSIYRPNHPSVDPTSAILGLLFEASDILIDPCDVKSHNPGYRHSLQRLEARVDDLIATPVPNDLNPESAFALELYRAATRIYIARASQSPYDAPALLDGLVDQLFNGPVPTCTCIHFFPLLILACEARRDDQRAAILNLIDRTQRDARIRSMKAVTSAIQAIWVQQDLHADSDVLVNYLDLLSIGIKMGLGE